MLSISVRFGDSDNKSRYDHRTCSLLTNEHFNSIIAMSFTLATKHASKSTEGNSDDGAGLIVGDMLLDELACPPRKVADGDPNA